MLIARVTPVVADQILHSLFDDIPVRIPATTLDGMQGSAISGVVQGLLTRSGLPLTRQKKPPIQARGDLDLEPVPGRGTGQ